MQNVAILQCVAVAFTSCVLDELIHVMSKNRKRQMLLSVNFKQFKLRSESEKHMFEIYQYLNPDKLIERIKVIMQRKMSSGTLYHVIDTTVKVSQKTVFFKD
jgi:hypothetical protein